MNEQLVGYAGKGLIFVKDDECDLVADRQQQICLADADLDCLTRAVSKNICVESMVTFMNDHNRGRVSPRAVL